MSENEEVIYITIGFKMRGVKQPIWKVLRDQLMKCINSMPGMHFESISANVLPDPFMLPDPDKPPVGFE